MAANPPNRPPPSEAVDEFIPETLVIALAMEVVDELSPGPS